LCLNDSNATYRRLACLGLATVQDSTYGNKLLKLLSDPEIDVQGSALYAIGQCGAQSVIRELIVYQEITSPQNRASEVFPAIAKLCPSFIEGQSYSQIQKDILLSLANSRLSGDADFSAWARAVSLLNRKGCDWRELHAAIPYHLQHAGPQPRIALAYALSTAPYPWAEENEKYFMSWLTTERYDQVRIPLMKLLGQLDSEDAEKRLVAYAMIEPVNEPVAIAAVRALGSISTLHPEILLPLVNHPSDFVLEEFYRTMAKRSSPFWDDALQLTEGRSITAQAEMHKLRWLAGKKSAADDLLALLRSAEGAYDKVAVIRALAVNPDFMPMLRDEYAVPDLPPAIRYAAAEAVVEMHNSLGVQPDFISSYVIPMWRTNEPGVQTVLATWVATNPSDASGNEELIELMSATLKSLPLPLILETYNEIAAALSACGIATEKAPLTGYRTTDWDLIRSIPQGQEVAIETNKGTFVVALDVDLNPVSVSQFIRLTREGFYNGKYFHRVVPNFVIQTGCPKGDGTGGLNEMIRSEFFSHTYEPGALGLASAGKDTESCQWFVTHVPTYWLEGRYTQFGNVTRGMEVVQAIRMGDQVISVKEVAPAK
jgi:cyclophilin family peptidyl-prolyl cis-trans isomerase